MIAKFFSRGSGGGSGPIDYLLGKDRERDQADVLRGDPEETLTLIDSSAYAKKYTAGVLSFEEEDLPAEQKEQIMTSFEEILLPGLDADQYNILWVQHQDKNRLELNFVVPNIELTRGKRLQPYYDRADRTRIRTWQNWINANNDFHDPDDPANRQAYTFPADLPKNKQQAATDITKVLTGMIADGRIKDRADIVETLEKNDFTIARQTRSSISIADPDGGRNIRLKGEIYEQTFRAYKHITGELETASGEFKRDREERAKRSRKLCQEYFDGKQKKNRKRYPRAQHPFPPTPAQELESGGPDDHANPHSHVRNTVVPGQNDRGSTEDDQRTGLHDRLPERRDVGDQVSAEPTWPIHHPAGRPTDQLQMDRRQTPGNPANRPGVTDDRTRETLTGYLGEIAGRIADEARRICEIFRRIAADVQRYKDEKRRDREAREGLKRAGTGFKQAVRDFAMKSRQRQPDLGIER